METMQPPYSYEWGQSVGRAGVPTQRALAKEPQRLNLAQLFMQRNTVLSGKALPWPIKYKRAYIPVKLLCNMNGVSSTVYPHSL